MKRVGNLFDEITSEENIIQAIKHSSAQKQKRRVIQNVREHKEQAAKEIRKMLISKEYKTKPYRVFTVKDGPAKKERVIHCPAYYPDQIIHWAVMQVTQNIIAKSMYEFCIGCVPGRGGGYGSRYIKKWLKRDRKNTKYCLQLDIKKYYPHIKTEILKQKFREKIKDKETLWLIDSIIDSNSEGLPIGNYTSQWWANFYLEGLDHYIKEQLHIKYYMRNVDDMVLFSANKKQLHKARKLIAAYIAPLGLTLKDNWQVFRIDVRPLDFLGFRFYRDHTTLRRRNALRIRRRVKKAYRKGKPTIKDARAILSYLGWIYHTNSRYFYAVYIKPYVNIKQLKEVIRNESRKQHQADRAFG